MTNQESALSAIRAAGVVGAGGGGFPTYRKLNSPASHILANGAECEPLMYKDREVMLQRSEEMIEGLERMRELTGASDVTLAVKRKNADVLDVLRPLTSKAGVATHVMEDVYPAGDEYVLVYDITGRRIPPGGIPLHVGVVVDNVETIVNVARALRGVPVTEKFLTVAGAVKEPVTVCVPVGTRISDCLAMAGGATVADPVVLTGGVMMGGLERDLSQPVSRTTAGLIVLPEGHTLIERKDAPAREYNRVGHSCCDQCSLCTELCPRYIMGYPIEPHRVMRSLMMTGEDKDRVSLWAQYCCECNVCSLFACPEKLDPKNICADAKRRLREQGLSRSAGEAELLFRPEHPARDGRQIPIVQLYQRLGLKRYDRHAHFVKSPAAPREVDVPLEGAFGPVPSPAVGEGAAVRRGDVIGDVPGGAQGCPAHASLDGTVTRLDARAVRIRAN